MLSTIANTKPLVAEFEVGSQKPMSIASVAKAALFVTVAIVYPSMVQVVILPMRVTPKSCQLNNRVPPAAVPVCVAGEAVVCAAGGAWPGNLLV